MHSSIFFFTIHCRLFSKVWCTLSKFQNEGSLYVPETSDDSDESAPSRIVENLQVDAESFLSPSKSDR